MFLAPIMLFGGFVVSIPVIIHLLNRRRYREVRWAAMDFLTEVVQTKHRVLKLKDAVLLALRCLALGCVVLAMGRLSCVHTRDSGTVAGPEGDATDALFIFDTSYSMGMVSGSQTLLERARRGALELLSSFGRGSRVQIVTVDETARTLLDTPTDDLSQAERIIQDEIRVSTRGGDMSLAIKKVAELLPALFGTRKDVYLFTDMQSRPWRIDTDDAVNREKVKALSKARGFYVIDVGDAEPQNLAIASLGLPDGLADIHTPTQFKVRVTNSGTHAQEDIRLGMRVHGLPDEDEFAIPDGKDELESEPLKAPDEDRLVNALQGRQVGNTQTISKIPPGLHGLEVDIEPYLFPKAGSYLVEAFLEDGDNLALDNSRFLAVEVREEVKILCVEGSDLKEETREKVGDTYYLRRLLAPYLRNDPDARFLYNPVRMTLDEVNGLDWKLQKAADESGKSESIDESANELDEYMVVVLANVSELSVDFIAALENFVANGGSLILFPGENTDSEDFTYSELLYKNGQGLLPARLEKVVGAKFAELKDSEQLLSLATTPGALSDVIFDTGNTTEVKQVTYGRPRFSKSWEVVLPKPVPDSEKEAPEKTDSDPEDKGERKSIAVGEPKVIARYSNEKPFAVRRDFGEGRVIFFTTTCDNQWNNLPYCTAFFMTYNAVRDLIRGQVGRASNQQGDKLIYKAPRDLAQETFQIGSPVEVPEEQRPVPAGKDSLGRQVWQIEFDNTGHPGGYCFEVVDADPESRARSYFAVNITPAESDLDRIESEELAALFPGINVQVKRYPAAIQEIITTNKTVTEISIALLLLATCFFLAETIVAALISPKPVQETKLKWMRA